MIIYYIVISINILILGILLIRINLRLDKIIEAFSKNQGSLKNDIEAVLNEVKKTGYVTDPFKTANKKNSIGSSSNHIVVPKTPDQIRNENFEQIKKGATYGHDS